MNVSELNFRSRPDLAPAAVVAKLHRGDRVDVLDPHPHNGFVPVSASIGDATSEGFVWEAYLAPDTGEPPPAPPPSPISAVFVPPEAHLKPQAKRANDFGHPYPLFEPPEPHRTAAGDPQRAESLLEIIRWLGVEKHKRYLRKPTTTYCNVYAGDAPSAVEINVM